MDPDEGLRGRRLALLGFGVENQALGRWLAARGLTFAVCDTDPAKRRDDPPWSASVSQWRLGPASLRDLGDFDLAFRSPGIPALRPELEEACRRGLEVSSQTALFLQRCPAPVVGVTGTKGKGTTVSLLAAMLDQAQVAGLRVGGNIGTPPITFLDDVERGEAGLVLLELSSFQLQDLRCSPHGAVLLPVTADHLDYHADAAEYAAAKGAICRHQRWRDWVLACADSPTAAALAAPSPGRRLWFRATGEVDGDGCWPAGGRIWWRDGAAAEAVADISDLRLRGLHNLGNACAAAGAARLCGVPAEAVAAGLRAFRGLPHRLEEVAERGGVLYVNDSLATTPEAAAAGLAAFADRGVVIIAGGSSKGADFADLGRAIAARARGLVTLGQEGERIEAAARAAGFSGPAAPPCAGMEEAVSAAQRLAQAGDVVLLSPGCASFGMFANYAERGKAFRRAVEAGS